MHIDENDKPEEEQPTPDPEKKNESAEETYAENVPLEDATSEEPQEEEPPSWERNRIDMSKIQMATNMVKDELGKVIVGQDEVLDLLMAALFTNGHVLLEGVPGIAKTLTAKLLSRTMDVSFSRIQFTPDLMPSDVLGTTVFNMQQSEFTFNPGPIFASFVLIDEINRAPAKTQAALFEVMEEYQVTIDGTTHPMEQPFFVMATQNPIEQEGTYKLPEAQLDRFLFKINMNYPDLEEEKRILQRFKNDFSLSQKQEVKTVFSPKEVQECRSLIEQVLIKDELLNYIAAIVHNTRENSNLFLGASPRASLAIMKTSKAIAAMNGRDFVTPDDIRYVAYPVLNHRIILTPEREMEGFDARNVIEDIIEKIEVPR